MKVISLNINKGKNWMALMSFLFKEKPGLLLLQEVLLPQVQLLCDQLSMHGVFGGMSINEAENGVSRGCVVLSTEQLHKPFTLKYGTFDSDKQVSTQYEGLNTVLVGGYLESLGCVVATTHFTLSLTPAPDKEQRKNLPKLLRALEKRKVGLLGVDLNSARKMPDGSSGEIWQELAVRMCDSLTRDVKTTLDPNHRWGNEPTVLDGMFYAPDRCRVHRVSLVSGVSDHKALVAYVNRTP